MLQSSPWCVRILSAVSAALLCAGPLPAAPAGRPEGTAHSATGKTLNVAQPLNATPSARRIDEAPTLSPPGGVFNDATTVQVQGGVSGGVLRVSLDGQDPTAESPLYTGPLVLTAPATVKARGFPAAGAPGPVAVGTFDVTDMTPPAVVLATLNPLSGEVRATFSEAVDAAGAALPANYTLVPDGRVTAAALQPDGRTVVLQTTLRNIAGAVLLAAHGICDLSPARNGALGREVELRRLDAVVRLPPVNMGGGQMESAGGGLPVGRRDPWSLNFFVRTEQRPEGKAVLGGFGFCDDRARGAGRYICSFPDGLRFWSGQQEVASKVALDVGPWQMLTATYDGRTLRFYKNGEEVAAREIELIDEEPRVRLCPLDPWERKTHFKGAFRDFTIWNLVMPPDAIKALWEGGK